MLNRRQLLHAGPALAVSPYLAGCEPPARPPGVPLSPFDRNSTAEEVTAGIDLSGKTALVTGCNSGIGYETLRVLALRGAHVFGAARTMDKAATACNSVNGTTTPLVIELTEPQSIVAAAEQYRSLDRPLDIIVCNAGIMELPQLELIDGVEKQFYVNHLGHFVLVNQLLPQLVAAEQGRIVNVSSGRATGNAPEEGIQFDNLDGAMGYDPGKAYGQSKLANILFTLELSRRLRDTSVTANALRPGVIATNLGRHMPRWKTIALETVGKPFTKTVAQGAATQCYLATAPELRTTSGYLFDHCNPILAGGYTEDTEMAARLWNVSEELVGQFLPAT